MHALTCSTSQGEWEATEAMCRRFEQLLKEHQVWNETTLFVNDEYEKPTAGLDPNEGKKWGETIASTVIGGAQALAGRLTGYTDK